MLTFLTPGYVEQTLPERFGLADQSALRLALASGAVEGERHVGIFVVDDRAQ